MRRDTRGIDGSARFGPLAAWADVLGLSGGGSLGARFTRGAAWNVLGTMGAQGLTLAHSILLAHLLGRSTYGEFGVLSTTIQTFVVFGTLGVGIGATKFVAEFKESAPNRAGALLASSLVFAVVSAAILMTGILFGAPALSRDVLHAPHLRYDVALCSVMLPLYALSWAQGGALQGFEDFRGVALLHIIRITVTLIATAALTPFLQLRGAVLSLVAGIAVACAVGHVSLMRACRAARVHPTTAGLLENLRPIYSFAVPALLGTAMATPVTWLTTVRLAAQPDGYAEVATLTVVQYWRIGISSIVTLLAAVSLPLFTSTYAKRDHDQFRRLFRGNLLVNIGIATVTGLTVTAGSGLILQAYGKSFVSGQHALELMMLSGAFHAVCVVADQALLGAGRPWQALVLNAGWAVVVVASAGLLVSYGAIGVAAAFGIGYAVRAAASLLAVKTLFSSFRPITPMARLEGSLLR